MDIPNETSRWKDRVQNWMILLLSVTLVGLLAWQFKPMRNLTSSWIREDKKHQDERAFALESKADLVIEWHRDHCNLKPREGKWSDAKFGELLTAIPAMTTHRDLVVVIICSDMRVLDDDPLRAEVDKMEALLKECKYRKIVFELGSAFGRPIYRE